MESESLPQDVSLMVAEHVLELFPKLNAMERRRILAEIYRRVMAGLEAFCIQSERMQRRAVPSQN